MSAGPHTTCLHATNKESYPADEWTQCYILCLKLATCIAEWMLNQDDGKLIQHLTEWISRCCAPVEMALNKCTTKGEKVCVGMDGVDLYLSVTVDRTNGFASIGHRSRIGQGSIPFGSQISQEYQATMPVEALLELLANLTSAT